MILFSEINRLCLFHSDSAGALYEYSSNELYSTLKSIAGRDYFGWDLAVNPSI